MEAILTQSVGPAPKTQTIKTWTARVLGALLVLFLFVDGAGKVLRLTAHVEGTAKVGFPDSAIVPMGITLIISTLLYTIPRTAVLGAILLTGYLGGAVATHVRMGQPFYFAAVFGVIVWGCLYLRDERIRALLPFAGRARERRV